MNQLFIKFSFRASLMMMLGLVLILLMGLVGCKSKSNNKSPASYDGGEIGITDFGGIKTIDEISDTTVHLIWDYHAQVSYYVIYKKELAPVADDDFLVIAHPNFDQTSITISGLTLNSTYSFKMHAYDLKGRIDDNQVVKTIQTTLAPRAPVAVSLKDPVSSPGFIRTPTFTVRYVKPGETIRIFKDAACTQQLGSGVVANDKNSIDIQSSMLPSGGLYEVYANATNIQGHTSACSAAYATYVATDCPDESYVPVEANEEYGTSAFCVFKTEAKNGGNSIPISAYEEIPWGLAWPDQAKTYCRNLTFLHGSGDLISNYEWMVIARDIEATDANWSGGEVGNGYLNVGHTDNNPSERLSISDPDDPWDQTGEDSSTWLQKRTHILSNGNVIWDFAGNVAEWTDWELGGDTITTAPPNCSAGCADPLSYECEYLDPKEYRPANPAGLTTEEYMSKFVHVGQICPRDNEDYRYIYRGCTYNCDDNARGIFSLVFKNYGHWVFIGFRCVWRPEQ